MTQKQQNQSDFDFTGTCKTCGIMVHSHEAIYEPGHFGDACSLSSKCSKCGKYVEVEQTYNGSWIVTIKR